MLLKYLLALITFSLVPWARADRFWWPNGQLQNQHYF